MKFAGGFLALMLTLSANLAAEEVAIPKPYTLTVWADVLYDNTGHPVQISFPAKDKYPAKFIQNLQMKLAMTKIEPPVENGLPATFETGVRINITVTPSAAGATVKIDGMYEEPRVVKKAMDKYPQDLLYSNWSGEARVKCVINLDGKCSSMEIIDSPNLPPSARKFALGSMKAWRFKLQKINGKPVPYVLIVPFSFETEDPYPPDFLRRF